jgi:antitoxin component YwqK of YwqJK toxin-antitoxin module
LKSKFIYILVALISNYNFFYAQQNDGLLENKAKITYWNKQKKEIRSVGKYKINGVLRIGSKIGAWQYFYPNGNPQETSQYYDGELHGEYSSFYANGKIKLKGNFTIGSADSTFEAYYYNGKLAEKGSYITKPEINPYDTVQLNQYIGKSDAIKSFKIGDWSYYYNNGEIMEQSYFNANDTTEYIVNYYDTTGEKIVSDGIGKLKSYFPSGKIRTIETIKKWNKKWNIINAQA